MDEKIRAIVRTAVLTIINDTASPESIKRSIQVHRAKIHFVPAKYRVLGGLLQSLNIKFGNFIEKLIDLVVDTDSRVTALPVSGKKRPFLMTAETDNLIDQYITGRQLPNSPEQCDIPFRQLLEKIAEIELRSNSPKQSITKDIDALFQTQDNMIVYLEIKYNDDHDTGKFVDINRKFLKTYAGLLNYLKPNDIYTLKPILYYFNPVKRWGPIYVPSSNIYRGAQLFDQYFEIKYNDIYEYLKLLENDEEIISIFDAMYHKIANL